VPRQLPQRCVDEGDRAKRRLIDGALQGKGFGAIKAELHKVRKDLKPGQGLDRSVPKDHTESIE
jgi:hypothetical protein